jgi:endonuclease/exonuclease/phosphatase family metal-dependent hydrolase
MIYVFNTHFDHRSAESRAESAKLLRKRVKAIDPAFPVIVVGDFNAMAETAGPYETLTGGRLKDARLDATEVVGPAGTGSGFNPEGRSTIPRIDWILYHGPLEPARFETIDRNKDGRYPSDHFPIVATFTWTVDEEMQARLRSGTR